jgi:hypothetical protein
VRGVSIILDVLLQVLLPIRQITHKPVLGFKTNFSTAYKAENEQSRSGIQNNLLSTAYKAENEQHMQGTT